MGQEERKNKAKLEKTQINVATSNTEYEAAIKVLEETTGRWNRDWKAAADKFQDLEEERLDFTKSSLWSFANIASTVCVSDDASCEKIRLSLENCEVEKDIVAFIKGRGTGQEIPDPPRYINFCRGDVNDTQSEPSEDESYSVAQFQRTINPAYRSSSPQPSVYESHHDPKSSLARELGHHEPNTPPSRETTLTPQRAVVDRPRQIQPEYQREAGRLQYDKALPIKRTAISQDLYTAEGNKKEPNRPQYEQLQHNKRSLVSQDPFTIEGVKKEPIRLQYEPSQHGSLATVPHDPYPMDGMTMLCRTGPPSERSSAHSGARPSSRDSQSEYSNPTSFSSQDPPSGKQSPVKQDIVLSSVGEKQVQKRKSGFFQNRSPFRRKSKHEKDLQPTSTTTANRTTFSVRSTTDNQNAPTRQPQNYLPNSRANLIADRPSGSPEPVDPRASFQLNVGNNVFDVAAPEKNTKMGQSSPQQNRDESDPIAQALAELKGLTKQSSIRISADHYHGISTPAPGSTSAVPSPISKGALAAGMRGTPPPSYDQPVQRLVLPQPAFTSKAMQQTSQKYVTQTQNMFNTSQGPESQGGYSSGSQPRIGIKGGDIPRATSPAPPRFNTSQRPESQGGYSSGSQPRIGAKGGDIPRATSPAPPRFNTSQRPESQGGYNSGSQPRIGTKGGDMPRSISPVPTRFNTSQGPESQGGYSSGSQPRTGTKGVDIPRSLSPAPPRFNTSQRPESQGGYNSGSQPRIGTKGGDIPRAISPAPPRSVSPRPMVLADMRQEYRSVSPNPYAVGQQRTYPQTSLQKRVSDQTHYQRNSSNDVVRAISPAPLRDHPDRPSSSHTHSEMAMQLAPAPEDYGGSQRGRGNGIPSNRPMSLYNGPPQSQVVASRQRSKSIADSRQYTRDGRPILHFGKHIS